MKIKLGNLEVWMIIDMLFFVVLEIFMLENLDVVKKIVDKGLMVVRVRMVVKKVCELICCKSVLEILNFSGKLVDCFLKDLSIFELYIVEGDFVGGFVK